MSMSLVEFSPQSASVPDIEQSEAARVDDTDIKLTTTISAKAATLDSRMINLRVFMQDPHTDQSFPQATAIGSYWRLKVRS
jgi:hypothetical protein